VSKSKPSENSRRRAKSIHALRAQYRRQFLNYSRAADALHALETVGKPTGGAHKQILAIEAAMDAFEWMFEQLNISPVANPSGPGPQMPRPQAPK
jgi:hypothetical protein